MFEIGFSEILLIMAIALVVLGPEKLPKLASTVGRWIGRAKAVARQFREQLEEEVNQVDLTKELNKQLEAAKRQLDIVKSLNESLDPARRTPAPEGVLAGEPLPEPVTTQPTPPEPVSPEPVSPEPDVPASEATKDARTAPQTQSHGVHDQVSGEPQAPPKAPSSIEGGVDSFHERRD